MKVGVAVGAGFSTARLNTRVPPSAWYALIMNKYVVPTVAASESWDWLVPGASSSQPTETGTLHPPV